MKISFRLSLSRVSDWHLWRKNNDKKERERKDWSKRKTLNWWLTIVWWVHREIKELFWFVSFQFSVLFWYFFLFFNVKKQTNCVLDSEIVQIRSEKEIIINLDYFFREIIDTNDEPKVFSKSNQLTWAAKNVLEYKKLPKLI